MSRSNFVTAKMHSLLYFDTLALHLPNSKSSESQRRKLYFLAGTFRLGKEDMIVNGRDPAKHLSFDVDPCENQSANRTLGLVAFADHQDPDT